MKKVILPLLSVLILCPNAPVRAAQVGYEYSDGNSALQALHQQKSQTSAPALQKILGQEIRKKVYGDAYFNPETEFPTALSATPLELSRLAQEQANRRTTVNIAKDAFKESSFYVGELNSLASSALKKNPVGGVASLGINRLFKGMENALDEESANLERMLTERLAYDLKRVPGLENMSDAEVAAYYKEQGDQLLGAGAVSDAVYAGLESDSEKIAVQKETQERIIKFTASIGVETIKNARKIENLSGDVKELDDKIGSMVRVHMDFERTVQTKFSTLEEQQKIFNEQLKGIQGDVKLLDKRVSSNTADILVLKDFMFSGLPASKQKKLIEDGFYGADMTPAIREKTINALNTRILITETARDIVGSVNDYANIAHGLKNLGLPIPDKLIDVADKGVKYGSAAINVATALIGGNPLGAVNAVFSLFGGGADPNQVRFEKIMGRLDDVMKKQEDILKAQKDTMQLINDLAKDIQDKHNIIMDALDELNQNDEDIKKIGIAILKQNLDDCQAFFSSKYNLNPIQKRFLYVNSKGEFLGLSERADHMRHAFKSNPDMLKNCSAGLENVFPNTLNRGEISPLFRVRSYDLSAKKPSSIHLNSYFVPTKTFAEILMNNASSKILWGEQASDRAFINSQAFADSFLKSSSSVQSIQRKKDLLLSFATNTPSDQSGTSKTPRWVDEELFFDTAIAAIPLVSATSHLIEVQPYHFLANNMRAMLSLEEIQATTAVDLIASARLDRIRNAQRLVDTTIAQYNMISGDWTLELIDRVMIQKVQFTKKRFVSPGLLGDATNAQDDLYAKTRLMLATNPYLAQNWLRYSIRKQIETYSPNWPEAYGIALNQTNPGLIQAILKNMASRIVRKQVNNVDAYAFVDEDFEWPLPTQHEIKSGEFQKPAELAALLEKRETLAELMVNYEIIDPNENKTSMLETELNLMTE